MVHRGADVISASLTFFRYAEGLPRIEIAERSGDTKDRSETKFPE